MSPVLTPAPPQAAPTRLGRNIVVVALGALLGLAVILGVSRALEGPGRVDRVTIDNPTPYAVEIAVAESDGGGRLTLGPVSPSGRHMFEAVVDQGDRWVVHVTSARSDGGDVVVSRATLERDGWVIRIPEQVGTKLGNDGATPRTEPQ
jgi:hypothetical protein